MRGRPVPILVGTWDGLTFAATGSLRCSSPRIQHSRVARFRVVDCIDQLGRYNIATGARSFINLDPTGASTTGYFLSAIGLSDNGNTVTWTQSLIDGTASKTYRRDISAGQSAVLFSPT